MGDEGNLGGLKDLLVDDNGLAVALVAVVNVLGGSQDSRRNQSHSGEQRGGNTHVGSERKVKEVRVSGRRDMGDQRGQMTGGQRVDI